MKKSLPNMHSNTAMVELNPLPLFFINKEPVLKLLLYNIFANIDEAELTKYLQAKGAAGFKIVDLSRKKEVMQLLFVANRFTQHENCNALVVQMNWIIK